MLLYADQEFDWFEPVFAGDEIKTIAEVQDLYERKKLQFLIVSTSSSNGNNKLVSRGKFTFVIRKL